MVKKWSIVVVVLFFSACKKQTYETPLHPMPKQFDYQCGTAGADVVWQWWQKFDDPVLTELVHQAIATNYDLAIALEKIEESRALYRIKRAELFPLINVVGQVTRSRLSERLALFQGALSQGPLAQGPRGKPFSLFQLGFDAFWEIDIWGKIWHAKNARYRAWQAQIEDMRNVYVMLVADVVRAYVLLCAENKSMQLLAQKVCIDKRLVLFEKQLFDAGLTSEIALVAQEQRLATSDQEHAQAQIRFAQIKNSLSVLIGANPEDFTLSCIAQDVPLYQEKITVGIPSELLRRRPDIRRQERVIAATSELVNQAIAEWFPSFFLLGSVFSEANKSCHWFKCGSVSWNIGPAINWPLINFGRIQANVAVKKSQNRQAVLQYSKTIIEALAEVENALIGYFTTQEQLGYLNKKLHDAQVEESLQNAKYTSGLSNGVELLRATKNKVIVDLERTDIQKQLSLSLVALYKALGGGW